MIFFTIGFCWYYGQMTLRRYLHCHAQTTALVQLSHRLGSSNVANESIALAESDNLSHSKSFAVEHQSASSDEDDERKTEPTINILPPSSSTVNENGHSISHRITFINTADVTTFNTSSSGNIVCSVTPGLGVFLTTSSRHTPHVFERVLARIHAVC
jgi:hypothetical protein